MPRAMSGGCKENHPEGLLAKEIPKVVRLTVLGKQLALDLTRTGAKSSPKLLASTVVVSVR